MRFAEECALPEEEGHAVQHDEVDVVRAEEAAEPLVEILLGLEGVEAAVHGDVHVASLGGRPGQ